MPHGAPLSSLEHCPDFDERHTLADGKTKGIPYPEINYNCNANWALVQQTDPQMPHGAPLSTLEHCPDFDERFKLKDGKTTAVPYPEINYNCNKDWALV